MFGSAVEEIVTTKAVENATMMHDTTDHRGYGTSTFSDFELGFQAQVFQKGLFCFWKLNDFHW